MASISESMSNMGGMKSHGLTSHMDGHMGMKHEPEGEHDDIKDHLKSMHEKHGGMHMHVHKHDGGFTTHHVGEDGEVKGPHDHENMEALKSHMNKFMNEEDGESEPSHESDDLM